MILSLFFVFLMLRHPPNSTLSSSSAAYDVYKREATENGGMPFGACRQVIWELCGNIPIHICDKNGLVKSVESGDLIPDPFDDTKLE